MNRRTLKIEKSLSSSLPENQLLFFVVSNSHPARTETDKNENSDPRKDIDVPRRISRYQSEYKIDPDKVVLNFDAPQSSRHRQRDHKNSIQKENQLNSQSVFVQASALLPPVLTEMNSGVVISHEPCCSAQ